MHIVVAMKQIPDLQQLRISNRKPVFDDVVYTYGDMDKNALEAAVQLKESSADDITITVLTVGNEETEETAKEALAAGADDAFIISDEDFSNLDSLQSSILIAKAVGQIGDAGALFLGEGSGDSYSGQVVGRVAEILGWPQVGFTNSVELLEGKAKVIRSLEDAQETIEVSLPAVFSFSSDANTPRVPKVTQILKAGRKPKEVLDSTDVEIDLPEKQIELISGLAPLNDRKGVLVASLDDLVDSIKKENLI